MKFSKLQTILSILIVGTFLFVVVIFTLLPVLLRYPEEEISRYKQLLESFWILFSAPVGYIIGYFFGQASNSKS